MVYYVKQIHVYNLRIISWSGSTDFLANIGKNSADERKRKHKPKQWLSQLKTE